jgi:hypothetical protein
MSTSNKVENYRKFNGELSLVNKFVTRISGGNGYSYEYGGYWATFAERPQNKILSRGIYVQLGS